MRGIDLKIARTRRRVKVTELAKAMGYNRHSRVSQIEAMAVVTPDAADKYLDALATFPVADTETETVS